MQEVTFVQEARIGGRGEFKPGDKAQFNPGVVKALYVRGLIEKPADVAPVPPIRATVRRKKKRGNAFSKLLGKVTG